MSDNNNTNKENKEIQKPITVVREEFKQKIIDAINESGLPAFVIEPIIADLLRETSAVVARQYEYDLKQYNDSIKEQKNEK